MSTTGNTKTTFSNGFEPENLLKQGHLWVAPIWSHKDGKNVPRPIVIVGNDHANDKIGVVINFITKSEPRDEFDVELKHWKEAGLRVKSVVRTAKPTTILKSELRFEPTLRDGIIIPKGYIGKLHDDDLIEVIRLCKLIF